TGTRWRRTTTRSRARRSCSSGTARRGSSSAGKRSRTSSGSTGSVTVVSAQSVRVGLLGCGNVGAALVGLIADHREEVAARTGVDLLFEAAVAGGIPIIRPLRESLAGDCLRRIMGIVNGTTNFILTRMSEEGQTFAEALAEAQSLGYAERDPTADVEGFDAAAKAAIIATVAFGVRVVAGDVYREGISGLPAADIAFAGRLGYVVKLLAITEADDGEVAVRVHPALVPTDHPLAAVRESYNAVFIEGAAVGDLMLYGRGAGGRPTASAVLGDVIDAASNRRRGTHAGVGLVGKARIRPIEDLSSQYYVALEVADKPGVLEAV